MSLSGKGGINLPQPVLLRADRLVERQAANHSQAIGALPADAPLGSPPRIAVREHPFAGAAASALSCKQAARECSCAGKPKPVKPNRVRNRSDFDGQDGI